MEKTYVHVAYILRLNHVEPEPWRMNVFGQPALCADFIEQVQERNPDVFVAALPFHPTTKPIPARPPVHLEVYHRGKPAGLVGGCY